MSEASFGTGVARLRPIGNRASLPRPLREPANVSPGSLATARRMIRERSRRHNFFDAGLFADPAWDMMLDLFVAEAEGRETPVMNLCLSSQVPETTTLRWVKTLEHAGVFIRQKDEHDQRRVLVRLSPSAAKSLAAYLDEAA
nr:winged helix DNA-binding protein [Sphingomonas bacterium]